MRLLIDNGVLFADGLFLCYARSKHARSHFNDGCYSVEIRKDALGLYVNVDTVGRIGAGVGPDAGKCDIILGSVLGRDFPLPCPALVERLLALVENSPKPVVMEINNG